MSRNPRDSQMEGKVYIGDLPKDAEEKELERSFSYYGRLKSVWVARNPAGFAFVEYEDARDAEDAVRELDGTNICGVRVRVEHATGKVRPKPWQRRGDGGAPPPQRNARRVEERCYQCGERGHLSRDCPRDRRGGGGGGGGRYSSGRRSYSKSRSRSVERRRSHSRSPSRSRSRERTRNYR